MSTPAPQSPEQVALAQAAADKALEAATLRQLSFKPGLCRDVAVSIVLTLLEDKIRWADEFDFAFVRECDRNVIGTTWRRLLACGIVERLNQHRRSIAKTARGREVWKYHLRSRALAETFLARNGSARPQPQQPEFFPLNTQAA